MSEIKDLEIFTRIWGQWIQFVETKLAIAPRRHMFIRMELSVTVTPILEREVANRCQRKSSSMKNLPETE